MWHAFLNYLLFIYSKHISHYICLPKEFCKQNRRQNRKCTGAQCFVGLSSVLLPSSIRGLATPWTYFLHFYPCPLLFWLTLPRRVLSTSSCCPSRPCVAFLACVHLALFLALSLSQGNSLVSSWCDHSMLASLLWRCLTVPSLLHAALFRTRSCVFFAVTRRIRLVHGSILCDPIQPNASADWPNPTQPNIYS